MKKTPYLNIVLALVACFMIAALILPGCTAAPAKPATPPVATGPKTGGVIKIGMRTAPTSLDTFVSGATGAAGFASNKIFGQTLVKWTGKNDAVGTVGPLLAKSWDISPDGLTYTFHLQEGIKFQNLPPVNGREITADDWVYHINRIADPASKHPARTTLDLKSCVAVDKYTFTVTTNQKSPGFLAYIANGPLVPYPKEVVEAPGGAGKNWVGTGAFILSEYQPNVKAVFKKNPDYWEKGKPYLDGAETYFMLDASSRMAAFRAGDLDVLPMETKSTRDAIERTVPGVQIQDGVGLLEAGLLLNNTRKPFDDKLVRQALMYAIDYDGLIAAALDGGATRTGFLSPNFTEYGAKPVSNLPKRDIAKAKALLAQAGYPDGFTTTIMQNTGNMEYVGNAVEPVVAMLKEVGIKATIVQADQVGFTSKWRAKDYDMAVQVLLTSRPFDPDNSLRQQWPTKGGFNFLGYSNPKVDELCLAQQAAFPDKAQRITIIKQILAILEDDVPSVPLYVTNNYFIKQPWVKGWDTMADPQGNYATQELPYVWLDKADKTDKTDKK
jgi:peptide/nickel transport system substrate-binding protein